MSICRAQQHSKPRSLDVLGFCNLSSAGCGSIVEVSVANESERGRGQSVGSDCFTGTSRF